MLSEIYINITNTELANKLNIPLSMVSKIKSGVSKKNEEVDRIIGLVENKGIIQAWPFFSLIIQHSLFL